ncbi:unnamed protein product, partial [Mesorhabditis belari]|uniref:polo kinase n=1 Tax=Mesorhabditis belari TaxID=2138241 RepID=A0AAF3F208_9BILA
MTTKKPPAKEVPEVVYDDKGSNQKEKMAQEITIHRDLCHPHVVRLDGYFEDPDNIYILLELCPRRSLMELHKRRGALTPPEARYMTLQIAEGIEYLHARAIIHRDLKLGNQVFWVKIGDFGLATTMEKGDDRKKTLCGTPNYIAPEVLEKTGHAFEVDVWALGCILYTLLVGTPPFETKSLQETYRRIKSNQYRIPSTIGNTAAKVIRELLAANPASRPKIAEVKKYAYFAEYTPTHLPTSCLTLPPKFSKMSSDCYAQELFNKLRATLLKGGTRNIAPIEDLAEAPECMPVFWVSKWVDYSDKYGIGYQLCDNSVGVLYNDNSRLVLDAAGLNLQYVERDNYEEYFMMNKDLERMKHLEKKTTLLKFFRDYMNQHLLKAGEKFAPKEGDELARLPCLRSWFRTGSAIVLHLTNGTLQKNT